MRFELYIQWPIIFYHFFVSIMKLKKGQSWDSYSTLILDLDICTYHQKYKYKQKSFSCQYFGNNSKILFYFCINNFGIRRHRQCSSPTTVRLYMLYEHNWFYKYDLFWILCCSISLLIIVISQLLWSKIISISLFWK